MKDCTQILSGMHRHLWKWWERVHEQGLNTNGFVHRITDHMYNDSDKKFFGIDWTDVSCKWEMACIILSHLSHGSHRPTKKTWRTMLPWYVGIQDDHELLDIIKSGTWLWVAAVHRDLTHADNTPLGLLNCYGEILFWFPAAVALTRLGSISDALVEW